MLRQVVAAKAVLLAVGLWGMQRVPVRGPRLQAGGGAALSEDLAAADGIAVALRGGLGLLRTQLFEGISGRRIGQ